MKRLKLKKYRFALVLIAAILFLVFACTVGSFTYEYADKKRQAKASLSYEEAANEAANEYKVLPSGEPIGIYVKTKGVMVINVTSFETADGQLVSPCGNLLKTGDYIESINGEEIKNKADFTEKIENLGSGDTVLGVIRNGEDLSISVTAYESSDGGYKLGVWVKDDIAGIGTLTFVDENGFAALGHSINDNETGEVFKISEGAIYNAKIINIVKPADGTPGKLEGIINYANKNMIGWIETNESDGISGYMTDNFNCEGIETEATDDGITGWVSLGKKEDVCEGKAYIISCVSGERKAYEIEIERVNRSDAQSEKNLEIKVTDSALLELTGGIVQGMSGSPIVQNGKLIGAVTHVFVNDSTKGYGIFIENMME